MTNQIVCLFPTLNVGIVGGRTDFTESTKLHYIDWKLICVYIGYAYPSRMQVQGQISDLLPKRI